MFQMLKTTKQAHDDAVAHKDFLITAALLMLEGGPQAAERRAKLMNASASVVGMLEKANTAAAITSGVGVLAAGSMLGSFMQSVRNYGSFETIASAALKIPEFVGRVVIFSTVAAGPVAEGVGKPVRALTLAASDITPTKQVALVVLSAELLRDLDDAGLAMLGRELRLSIATAGDAALFAALPANSAEAQGQPTWQGLIDDLTELARMVALGAGSRPYLIVAPSLAKQIAAQGYGQGISTLAWNGGPFGGLEMLVSDSQTADRLTLVDATGLAVQVGEISLRSSGETTLQMDTAPTQDSGVPTQSTLVSLFQTGSVGLLAERSLAIKPIRNLAYAHLTNIAFAASADSPLAG